MTFSLVARCTQTGMFGVAVASSSPAVAARCAFARSGVGAALTQNVTDPSLGPRALDLIEGGASASDAVARVADEDRHSAYRQILAVDGNGLTGVHSGSKALGIWADARAGNVASGGNLLADAGVPQAIVDGFIGSEGHLGSRLLSALRSGLVAGGEAGPIHSAGMMIVHRLTWPLADLRCDWSEDCPVERLQMIWTLYAPQMDAYVERALDPVGSPSYGVPGDE